MDAGWDAIFDHFARLLPGGLIISALLIARKQLAAGRRGTAVTIAKNHYRDALQIFFENADLVFAGASELSYRELKADTANYRRYRWIATIMLFSFQEVYLTLGQDQQWRQAIIVIGSLFKQFILSETDFPASMRASVDPKFWAFIYEAALSYEHPGVKLGIFEFKGSDLPPTL